MKSEAYIKLENAIKNDELYVYLLGQPEYRLSSHHTPNFSMMNDYRTLVVTLNEYGKTHLSFGSEVEEAVKKCLDRETPGAAYSITQIIRQQLTLENKKMNSIEFITKEIYEKLKNVILKNKEFFNNFKEYEGSLYNNGMNGAFEYWDNEIYSQTGNKIL